VGEGDLAAAKKDLFLPLEAIQIICDTFLADFRAHKKTEFIKGIL